MTVRAYVLILSEVGRARSITESIGKMDYPGVRLVSVDAVTGPYDVVARLEAETLDRLADAVTSAIQAVPGVEHTVTCPAVRLA
jgi:DNA-binding Lrp family transcriptional regulator